MKAGLVGDHIASSLTPDLHRGEGAALGLDYSYERFDTADGMPLAEVVARARSQGFAGLNITHPHKQAVIPLLDRLEAEAARIGSVNTIVFRDGDALGLNTDYTGFASALASGLGSIAGQSVRLFGAGGAGAAVAFALLDAGVGALSLHDIDPARATALAATLGAASSRARISLAGAPDEDAAQIDGLVNCTPMGMAATPGMAVDPRAFRPGAWAFDIVYFPRDTAFLRAARDHGMRVVDGTGMALWQAVGAFTLITGQRPDPARMAAHLERLLHARNPKETP